MIRKKIIYLCTTDGSGLKRIGITVNPVILSTRSNGILASYSPTLHHFNYLVAYINHDGIRMLLDAAAKECVPGILPPHCLNGSGLVVQKDVEQWIELNPGYKHKKSNLSPSN